VTFLRVTSDVESDPDRILASFWDMARLQAFWNPVSHVEILYDDGRHQEAWMSVQRNGHEESIRIIRFRVGSDIVFFNPVPPPMMRYHRGAWRIATHPQGGCTVSAERDYELIRNTADSDEEYAARVKAFDLGLQRRLRDLLESLARATAVERSA
jgi:hypothetical protein